MPTSDELWNELMGEVRAAARLEQVRGLLAWDQQVGLPPKGGETRSEQLALVMGLQHARFTAPRVGELLETLSSRTDLDEDRAAGVANHLWDWRRAVAVPTSVVERLGRLDGLGHAAWMEARAERRFDRFAPILREIVATVRERASAIDSARPAYDVLLEDYERGATSASIAATFARLRDGLVVFLDAIRGATPLPELTGTFDAGVQLRVGEDLARALGYDLGAGRIDLAPHPFTIQLGPGDVRITTRIDPDDLLMMLGGTMHEVGHALYEQGLPGPVGCGIDRAASMGLHESQSRFWENAIGRSLPFFRWLQGPLRERFGAAAPDADTLYAAANRVVPGPNRVLADEATYNLHVIVRFELEQALFAGRVAVDDLRDAWNDGYRRTLGVDPADDVAGVLQDIHWSSGGFGYFPTYTLGNLYAATLGAQLSADLPDLWDHVGRGDFAPALGWLRTNVHRQGRRYRSEEIVRRAAGTRDPVEALLDHLWARHGALHGVSRPTPTA